MKRTISEVIELIKQKKEGLEYMLSMADKELNGDFILGSTRGQIMILKDVLSLLETSHLIEQEEIINILKEHITCKQCKVSTEPDVDEYEYYIVSKHPTTRDNLDIEEYDVLSEVFKDNE